jgi:cytochrome c oxidase assembly protein subunit 15
MILIRAAFMPPIQSQLEVTEVGKAERQQSFWSAGGRLRGGYRSGVLVSIGLVYLTVLLGVSTRATAAGLACNANWPLCDGGLLNLFPATMPSAFEWIHRVIAMFAGFAIVGTAALAYRNGASRRIMGVIAAGTLLLPLQVILGRETVVSFVPEVLAAHYWTAMAIYGLFVTAAVWAYADAASFKHVRRALLGGLVLLPAVVTLGPPVVSVYTAPIQAAQYAVLLPAFAALLFAGITGWRLAPERSGFRALLLTGAGLLPVVVYLMRQSIVQPPDSFISVSYPVGILLLFVVVGAATVQSYRTTPDPAA